MSTKDIRQNGLDKPVRIPLEFIEGPGEIARTLHHVQDEPISIKMIESGWNYGYPTYHVIIEYGDMEQTDYHFMSADDIKKSFGVDMLARKNPNAILIAEKEILERGNDDVLGQYVRLQYNFPHYRTYRNTKTETNNLPF
jgi:hypothetical protein